MEHKQSQVKYLDLGTRKVSDMNFSKIVTLPKAFTANYLTDSRKVAVSLSADGKLILTPVKADKKSD